MKLDKFFQEQRPNFQQRLLNYFTRGSTAPDTESGIGDAETIFGSYLAYYNVPSFSTLGPLLRYVQHKVGFFFFFVVRAPPNLFLGTKQWRLEDG